jgi:uncharacterized membrane protein
MTEDRRMTRRISVYVHAVEHALASMNSSDRDAVLEDVEDHIEAALNERATSPTLDILESVLADLGSPESYAAEIQAQFEPEPGALDTSLSYGPAELCKMAPMGLAWSMLVLAVALPAMLTLTPVSDGAEVSFSFARRLFQALAWFSLAGVLGGPLLSILAVSKIRASAGRLYGLGIAVLGMYLLPLTAIDIVLVAISDNILVSLLEEHKNLAHGLAVLVLLLCFAWNGWAVRRSIQRLRNREPGSVTSATA